MNRLEGSFGGPFPSEQTRVELRRNYRLQMECIEERLGSGFKHGLPLTQRQIFRLEWNLNYLGLLLYKASFDKPKELSPEKANLQSVLQDTNPSPRRFQNRAYKQNVEVSIAALREASELDLNS